eukprot:TRINITY_DN71889_c0_g1_i1.p1 TRINITY_DN71889_c0_g1~~TRINITY_DN71889_c0_g1_i1.p1  ORF type:complete len:311 (+),score=48.48 TRINITY_DN71889_c0_g1_i1:121-1053(+)
MPFSPATLPKFPSEPITDSDVAAAQATLTASESSILQDGYAPFMKHASLTVYRRTNPRNPKLYEYYTVARVNAPLHSVLAVMCDTDYRKSWDPYCKECSVVPAKSLGGADADGKDPSTAPVTDAATTAETPGASGPLFPPSKDGSFPSTVAGSRLVYFDCKYPFPMSDRDYVYWQRLHMVAPTAAIIISSSTGDVIEENKKIIRVTDYFCKIVCVAVDPAAPAAAEDPEAPQSIDFKSPFDAARHTATTIRLVLADDPKGSIPAAVVNWAQKKAPEFIAKLETAAKAYPHPPSAEGHPLAPVFASVRPVA